MVLSLRVLTRTGMRIDLRYEEKNRKVASPCAIEVGCIPLKNVKSMMNGRSITKTEDCLSLLEKICSEKTRSLDSGTMF